MLQRFGGKPGYLCTKWVKTGGCENRSLPAIVYVNDDLDRRNFLINLRRPNGEHDKMKMMSKKAISTLKSPSR